MNLDALAVHQVSSALYGLQGLSSDNGQIVRSANDSVSDNVSVNMSANISANATATVTATERILCSFAADL